MSRRPLDPVSDIRHDEPTMSDAIHIEEVDTIDHWLALGPRLYLDDPTWVPPLDAWVRRRTDPEKNGFLKEATLRLFVARRAGEVVGHISALRDPKHERLRDEAVGFFGFFDCVHDFEVARALVERVTRVVRDEWGLSILRGPRNLSRVEEVGVLVEGFENPQPMLTAASRPYYPAFFEGLGFEVHHDVLAYDIEMFEADGSEKPLPEKLATKAAAVDIPGLELDRAHLRHLKRDLYDAHHVFVDAFRNVPENTPMPRGQFVGLALPGLLLSDRSMLQLARVNGKPAGFALCFPELNEAIRRAEGEAMPFGWAKALAALSEVKTASFKLIGVLPEYKGSGLHALMIARAIEGVRGAGFKRLEASLVDARNKASRGVVEGAGMEVYRRYRLFERDV